MPFEVEDPLLEAKSRLVFVQLCGLTLRLMENWHRAYVEFAGETPDYETTMIITAIMAISGERLLRTEIDERFQTLAEDIPFELIGKCNLSSIAAATGLNRETVRRKMNGLEKAGIVARYPGGHVWFQRMMDKRLRQSFLRTQIDAVRQTVRQFVKLGLLRHPPGPAYQFPSEKAA